MNNYYLKKIITFSLVLFIGCVLFFTVPSVINVKAYKDYPCAGHGCGCESLQSCMDKCCCYPSLKINKVKVKTVANKPLIDQSKHLYTHKTITIYQTKEKGMELVSYNSCRGGKDGELMQSSTKKSIDIHEKENFIFQTEENWQSIFVNYFSVDQKPSKKVPIKNKLV
jgi:hypothetical protein